MAQCFISRNCGGGLLVSALSLLVQIPSLRPSRSNLPIVFTLAASLGRATLPSTVRSLSRTFVSFRINVPSLTAALFPPSYTFFLRTFRFCLYLLRTIHSLSPRLAWHRSSSRHSSPLLPRRSAISILSPPRNDGSRPPHFTSSTVRLRLPLCCRHHYPPTLLCLSDAT